MTAEGSNSSSESMSGLKGQIPVDLKPDRDRSLVFTSATDASFTRITAKHLLCCRIYSGSQRQFCPWAGGDEMYEVEGSSIQFHYPSLFLQI